MAPAWGAALIEIVRRKEYARIFMSKAREMAEILARFRLVEEKRRENFKTEIVQYLPPGLIVGLDDKPPLSDITISNTQDNLPSISTTDIMGDIIAGFNLTFF